MKTNGKAASEPDYYVDPIVFEEGFFKDKAEHSRFFDKAFKAIDKAGIQFKPVPKATKRKVKSSGLA